MTKCVPPPLPGEGQCELAEPKHLNMTDANEARPGLWCVAVTLRDVCDRDALLALRVDGMLRISIIREHASTSRGRCLHAFVTAFAGTSAKAPDGPSSSRPDDDHEVVACYLFSDLMLLRQSRMFTRI